MRTVGYAGELSGSVNDSMAIGGGAYCRGIPCLFDVHCVFGADDASHCLCLWLTSGLPRYYYNNYYY